MLLLMFAICNCFQAKNVVNKEIVAIKKMSYSGKQAAEVCSNLIDL